MRCGSDRKDLRKHGLAARPVTASLLLIILLVTDCGKMVTVIVAYRSAPVHDLNILIHSTDALVNVLQYCQIVGGRPSR